MVTVRKKTDFIIIHCSATPPDMDVDAKEIDRWHRQKGWLMIGYHFVIKRDGTRERGRQINEPGAHCMGYNHRSVGICMVGGVDKQNNPENNFTAAQWTTLAITVKEMQEQYKDAFVIGHREVQPGKACPSFDVQAWLLSEVGKALDAKPVPTKGRILH
jgi:N-acetyl-anhydromuramyl-L-alanine amidase AmpD